MPSGGKRPKSGRKKGATGVKTRKIADEAIQRGISPLEVMLDNMRFAHEEALKYQQLYAEMSKNQEMTLEQLGILAKDCLRFRSMAQECAKDASPYIHPRLASIEYKSNQGNELKEKSTDEIDARILELSGNKREARAIVAPGGEKAKRGGRKPT